MLKVCRRQTASWKSQGFFSEGTCQLPWRLLHHGWRWGRGEIQKRLSFQNGSIFGFSLWSSGMTTLYKPFSLYSTVPRWFKNIQWQHSGSQFTQSWPHWTVQYEHNASYLLNFSFPVATLHIWKEKGEISFNNLFHLNPISPKLSFKHKTKLKCIKHFSHRVFEISCVFYTPQPIAFWTLNFHQTYLTYIYIS